MSETARRRGLMASNFAKAGIPDDYQEVRWIECAYKTNSYVKTNIAIKDIQTVEYEGSVWKGTDTTGSIMFYRTPNNELRIGYFSNYSYYRAFICSPEVPMSNSYTGNIKFTISGGYGSETAPLYLFGGPTGTSGRGRSIRCSKFTINGGKLFYGIPVYRKTDNKIGLYDFVSKAFYPAIGSFTKGADVE